MSKVRAPLKISSRSQLTFFPHLLSKGLQTLAKLTSSERSTSVSRQRYGGPAQPSPIIAQCLNGMPGLVEVKCRRCETAASIPLDADPSAARHENLQAWRIVPLLVARHAALPAARAHDQTDREPRNHALRLDASGRWRSAVGMSPTDPFHRFMESSRSAKAANRPSC